MNLFNAEINAVMHLAAVIESSIEAKFPNLDSRLVKSNTWLRFNKQTRIH